MNKADELRTRTKLFALRIIRLYRALPHTGDAEVLGKQLLRSGTSIGANYRAACIARSRKEFMSKLGIVVEEADETVYWLELIVESGIMTLKKCTDILQEAIELAKIMSVARSTVRKNDRMKKITK